MDIYKDRHTNDKSEAGNRLFSHNTPSRGVFTAGQCRAAVAVLNILFCASKSSGYSVESIDSAWGGSIWRISTTR